jgi:hypothetical protein
MSNVVGIPGLANSLPPDEPDRLVVALLREWLSDAERGELVGVVIGGVKRGGGTRTEWSGVASADQMLGAAAGLQHRVAVAWASDLMQS